MPGRTGRTWKASAGTLEAWQHWNEAPWAVATALEQLTGLVGADGDPLKLHYG